MIVVPSAVVASAVIVFVVMRELFGQNVMTAGNRMPMVFSVIYPFAVIRMRVIVVPLAGFNVANTVIVFVHVLTGDRLFTFVTEKVAVFIHANSMLRLELRVAFVTNQIFICVFVSGAGCRCASLIVV